MTKQDYSWLDDLLEPVDASLVEQKQSIIQHIDRIEREARVDELTRLLNHRETDIFGTVHEKAFHRIKELEQE